jgi:hypothetical protein
MASGAADTSLWDTVQSTYRTAQRMGYVTSSLTASVQERCESCPCTKGNMRDGRDGTAPCTASTPAPRRWRTALPVCR